MLGRLFLLAAMMLTMPVAATTQPAPKLDVEYEPTPMSVVHAMLKLAEVGPDDYVMDLGCGDGRVPIAAAKSYGAKGYGVDLDPERIREAHANAQKAGVEDKVTLVHGDLFKEDLTGATVITLFLWPTLNMKLRPTLLGLAPGTRIVSHEHTMGDWRPDRMLVFNTKTAQWRRRPLHLWVVPAKIDGSWKLDVDGVAVDVSLKQKFQDFSGSATANGSTALIRKGRVTGDRVAFDIIGVGVKRQRLIGVVKPGGTMEGADWRAVRLEPGSAPGAR
jgi:SAM-dependent methyltransferase